MSQFASAIYHPERFKPAFDDLLAGNRIDGAYFGDSNLIQNANGHHIDGGRSVWGPKYGVWGSRLGGGFSAGNNYIADTKYFGIDVTADNFFLDATSPNAPVATRLGFRASNTDGTALALRFAHSAGRLRPGTNSPAGAANYSQYFNLVMEHESAGGPPLRLAEDGGRVAYSVVIPPVSGGTLRLAARLQWPPYTELGSVDLTARANAVLRGTFPIAVNASTLPRLVQANRAFVDQSSGEAFIVNLRGLRAGVTGKTGGPGGISFTAVWANGGQGLANLCYDLNQQTAEALQNLFIELNRFSSRVVCFMKHKQNDLNTSLGSYDYISNALSGVAGNTKQGYKYNFEYWCKSMYDAHVSAGGDPSKLHLIAAGYHPQTGVPLEQYEDAEREVSDNGTPWGSRVTCVAGSKLTSPAEMLALGWYANNVNNLAHMSPTGFIGFNTREHDGLFAAAYPKSGRTGFVGMIHGVGLGL